MLIKLILTSNLSKTLFFSKTAQMTFPFVEINLTGQLAKLLAKVKKAWQKIQAHIKKNLYLEIILF